MPCRLSDIQHHLHPDRQLRELEREGPLVIVRGKGYIEGVAGLWCASPGFSPSGRTAAPL